MEQTSSSSSAGDDHAGVIVMPPVLYVSGFVLSLVPSVLWPWNFPGGVLWRSISGGVILFMGACFLIDFVKRFRASGQDKNPNTPTPSIITDGMYQISRNPAYVGLTLMLLGIGLVGNSVWMALVNVPIVIVIHFGVILREERYLERRFGEEYLLYRKQVRRWL